MILKEALNKVSYTNPEVNACIVETVLGRKDLSQRSGMIFWAHDLGDQKLAKELLQFVMKLLTVRTSDEKLKSRLDRNIRTCYLISSNINISVE